jgi:hypothetical protein
VFSNVLINVLPKVYKDYIQWDYECDFQRPILNFALWGKLWPQGRSCHPEVNFVPWGRSYPLGVKFFVRPSILLNCTECSPLGVNEGVKIPPREQFSSLGAKATPRGAGLKLRMTLRSDPTEFRRRNHLRGEAGRGRGEEEQLPRPDQRNRALKIADLKLLI